MVMVVSCTLPAMAADKADGNQSAALIAESNEFIEKEAIPTSSVQYLWKSAFTTTKWAVAKADNALFNRGPQITDPGGNWAAGSSDDCWIYRYDFSADYARSATPSNTPSYASNMVYDPDTQKSYIISSDTAGPSCRSVISDNTLTAQDLVDGFYDGQQDRSVNRLKSFDVGDTIFATDVVTDLKYNESTNITQLYFGNTTDGPFSWPFAGDLRSQISVNDKLTFEFNVVEEYSTDEYSFETLDCFLESYDLIAEGTAADIQDYLIG